MEAVPLRKHRVDERGRDVEAAPAGLQHPLDELVDLRGVEPEVGHLVAPAAGDEQTAGSLIHTSSTSGSSRKGCSGPNPDKRATSSPTIALPNTGGYLMHILESASHQIPLAANAVRTDHGWVRDDIDRQ